MTDLTPEREAEIRYAVNECDSLLIYRSTARALLAELDRSRAGAKEKDAEIDRLRAKRDALRADAERLAEALTRLDKATDEAYVMKAPFAPEQPVSASVALIVVRDNLVRALAEARKALRQHEERVK